MAFTDTISKYAAAFVVGGQKDLEGGHPTGYLWSVIPTGGRIPRLGAKVSDGMHSSIIVACLDATFDAFSEPPFAVFAEDAETTERTPIDHPMADLIEQPNDDMDAEDLWWHYIVSTRIHGDAIWVKTLTPGGRVVELWPLRPDTVAPIGPDQMTPAQRAAFGVSDNALIGAYRYQAGTREIIFPKSQIVHMRRGLNPQDYRRGFSPFQSLLKEILTDEEAAAFTASLLSNLAIPSVIISPEDGQVGTDDADEVKSTFIEKFGGANRGQPMVMTGPTKVDRVSWNPRELELTKIRRIPEERIAAALGVPAIVANLGAGMEMSSGRSEAKAIIEQWTERRIVPDWNRVGRRLTRQVLVENFTDADRRGLTAGFDIRNVRALQEDRNEAHARELATLKAGGQTVGQFYDATGRQRTGAPLEEMLLLPMSVQPTPASDAGAPSDDVV